MKSCPYCRRENDDATQLCPQCGTSFPVSLGWEGETPVEPCPRENRAREDTRPPGFKGSTRESPLGNLSTVVPSQDRLTGAKSAFHVPDPLAGGTAVVLICAGVSLAMQAAFPAVFAFSLFLMAWMFVLALAALALTLYTGSVCCRTSRGRFVLSLILAGILLLGWPLWFPAEASLESRVSHSSLVCLGAAILIAVGTLTLVWLARRNCGRQGLEASGRALGGGRDTSAGNQEDLVGQTPKQPTSSPARVVGVSAGLLFLWFLIFLAWLYSTPHR